MCTSLIALTGEILFHLCDTKITYVVLITCRYAKLYSAAFWVLKHLQGIQQVHTICG